MGADKRLIQRRPLADPVAEGAVMTSAYLTNASAVLRDTHPP
jgi:hypothetical protein